MASALIFGSEAFGQPGSVDSAPPPVSVISRAEQEQLDKKNNNIGDRIKLAIKLMESRASGAESAFSQENYEQMFRELGTFHALMEDSLAYLDERDNGRGKVLDNFKRLEIAFRKFMPRFETIRREVPLRYEDYVRKLVIRLRDARSRATEPLFGETVLPTRKQP
jgi:hypothetical protein